MSRIALSGARILSASGWVDDAALIVSDGRIERIAEPSEAAPGTKHIRLDGGVLLPGFIDVQVNGGGGVMFNDAPTVDGIAAIGAAHRRFGTTGFLPTLISDDLAKMKRAIGAVRDAIEAGVPGVLGIHLEGPFLNPERKGIHDAAKFRTISPDMLDMLSSLPNGRTVLTLAPEVAPPGIIRALTTRGVIVCAAHSSADYAQTRAALDEGLAGFTHLFNAMTPFASRAPGMVGAALEDRHAWCGIIVDGHHVHPAALRVAMLAHPIDRFMLVTDAMSTVGAADKSFTISGQRIAAKDGMLAAADGTLAGSDLDMASAVRNAVAMLGLDLAQAARLGSAGPAAFLGLGDDLGVIAPGARANLVHLGDDGHVRASWIDGIAETYA